MKPPIPRLPRPKPMRERDPLRVGLVGLLIVVLLALLAYNADSLPLVGGGTGYSAYFTESAGLTPGNEVRIAGVKVGKVTEVKLDGDRVRVGFEVKGAWVGDSSTVAIGIKTLLGEKYLAVDPLGGSRQNPSTTIPVSRTTSPFDVTQALNGLGQTTGQIDSAQLAQSFQAMSDAFKNTSPDVRSTLTGLSALSQTISKRDTDLTRLLSGSKKLTGTLAGQSEEFQTLITDGNQLLTEIESRRDAVHALLVGAQNLSTQLSGVVQDNQRQLAPTLDALDRVTAVLRGNQQKLDQILALAGPYYRLVGNTLGNGRWMDTYLCGLTPKAYLPAGTTPSTGCMPPKGGL
ncbi:MCE family protein [Streptacidiphilus sp. N1-3]|uniref:MCE family protein n=1 Tax=Streptacidiphilus alkalitolerans TaxID=3342712 RepID=A0ABV6XD16_9ACTN